MKTMQILISSLIIGGFIAANVLASPMLYSYQDGDVNPFTGTSEDMFGGAGTEPPTLNTVGARTAVQLDPNVGNTLLSDVVFTPDLTQAGYQSMTAYGPSGTQIAGMRFDFYAGANGDGTGAPVGLGFYFQTTGGHVWYYDIANTYIGNGWNTYAVPFIYDAGVYGTSGWYGYEDNSQVDLLGSGDFTTDLGIVNRLGIWITYQDNNSDQVYGIDDFGLTVPEPETYVVLGMALLSVAFIFRKRITVSLAEARAMMQM